jgi:hypothetical protein
MTKRDCPSLLNATNNDEGPAAVEQTFHRGGSGAVVMRNSIQASIAREGGEPVLRMELP